MYNAMYIGGGIMTLMVRKQVYITPKQDADLKRKARELGVTESELIRRGIDQVTNAELSPEERDRLWQEAMEFMRRRAEIPVPPGTKPWKWNRDEIYEERINHYSR